MALSVPMLFRYIVAPILNVIQIIVIILIIRSTIQIINFRRSLTATNRSLRSIYLTTLSLLILTTLQLTALCLLIIYKTIIHSNTTGTDDHLQSGLYLYILQNYVYIVALFTRIRGMFQNTELRLSRCSSNTIILWIISVPLSMFSLQISNHSIPTNHWIVTMRIFRTFALMLSLSVIVLIVYLNAIYICKLRAQHVLNLHSEDVLNTFIRRQIQSTFLVAFANLLMITQIIVVFRFGNTPILEAVGVYSVTFNLAANCLSISICFPLFLSKSGKLGVRTNTAKLTANLSSNQTASNLSHLTTSNLSHLTASNFTGTTRTASISLYILVSLDTFAFD